MYFNMSSAEKLTQSALSVKVSPEEMTMIISAVV